MTARPRPGARPADLRPPDTAPALAVRVAGPADAAALAAFAERTFVDTYGATSRAEDVAAYVAVHFAPALQGAELADPAMTTLLAEHDGAGAPALAGYLQLRRGARWPADARPSDGAPPPADPGTEVARLYVDRPWHGRGVADRLMAAAVARAGGALWLCAWQRNARAVAFYRRWGFAVAGVGTFVMGTEVQDDWILARPAPSAPTS